MCLLIWTGFSGERCGSSADDPLYTKIVLFTFRNSQFFGGLVKTTWINSGIVSVDYLRKYSLYLKYSQVAPFFNEKN